MDDSAHHTLNDIENEGLAGKFKYPVKGRSSSLSPSFIRNGKLTPANENKAEDKPKKPLIRRWSIDKELLNLRPVTGHASVVLGTNLLRSFQPIMKTTEKQLQTTNRVDSPQRGRPVRRQRLRSNSAEYLVKPVLACHTECFTSNQRDLTENSSSRYMYLSRFEVRG